MVAAIAAAGVLLAVLAGLATPVRSQPAQGPGVPGLVPGDPVARDVTQMRPLPRVLFGVTADDVSHLRELVTSVRDLTGKTVAVNALDSFSELAAEKSIDLAGGDSSKVKFVEVPIPQMPAAVKAGTVAGAAISEPFLSAGKAAGLKDLMPILYRVFPNAPMVVYLASTAYASSHPQVIKQFADAITAANTALGASTATLESVSERAAKLTATQVAQVILPTYVPTPLSLTALGNVMKVMMEYKVLTAPIDLRSHVYGS